MVLWVMDYVHQKVIALFTVQDNIKVILFLLQVDPITNTLRGLSLMP